LTTFGSFEWENNGGGEGDLEADDLGSML
jgi:hypothetical protein